MSHIYRTVSVPVEVPPEIRGMLIDFKDMVNWLISWGIHSRVHNKMRMGALTTEWFEARWRPEYAAHYHEAACSVASQQLSSWLELGGDTSSLPYLTKPVARLRSDLFRIELNEQDFRLRIVLEPHHFVYLTGKINHGKLSEYETGALGEVVVFDNKVNLVWRSGDLRPRAERVCGIDTNFDRLVLATDDGRIDEVSLKKVVEVQQKEKEVRHRIQSNVNRNLARQHRLLKRRAERERNRVRDILNKTIVPDFLAKTDGYGIGFDDLRQTTRECIRTSSGKRFHERLSAWVHGSIQTITNDHSALAPLRPVYTRGTSTWCPFCGMRVSHPTWKVSRCSGCGLDFDRDRLSAVSGLIRAKTRHKRGEAWATADRALRPEVVEALRRQCVIPVLPHEGHETTGRPFEQVVREVPVVASDGGLLLSAASYIGDGNSDPGYSGSTTAGHKTAMTPMTRSDPKYESDGCYKRLSFRQPSLFAIRSCE